MRAENERSSKPFPRWLIMHILMMMTIASQSIHHHAEKVSHTSKSKCENQLAADDFEALFETSK